MEVVFTQEKALLYMVRSSRKEMKSLRALMIQWHEFRKKERSLLGEEVMEVN
jgi:hypothetical protein